ncbi:MAG: DNA-3-methyladenine glycosylase [Micrococcaceae bacterium]
MTGNSFDWLDTSATIAAKRLLGCELLCTIDGESVRVKIIEVEAYDQNDEASHTFNGKTKRNAAMFKSAGHMYVYFTYGMHHCCNIVCGKSGFGSGVLIRAVEPVEGIDIIEKRRGMAGVNVTNGPGKVCKALNIDLKYTGHDLANPPIQLIKKSALSKKQITIDTRIGISKATNRMLRFYITENPYISKK